MGTRDFLIMYCCLLTTMLLCRCVPLFVLKGRDLSPRLREAIGLIPAAAFAALVANDLFQPKTLSTDVFAGMMPILAALPVVFVARRTGSLIWSAIAGMLAYAALLYLPALMG